MEIIKAITMAGMIITPIIGFVVIAYIDYKVLRKN